MLSRRKPIGLFLTFLFLVMQAFWLVHHFGHDPSLDEQEETACEFCLAMHGMGAAVSGQERTTTAIPLDGHCPGCTSIVRIDAEFIQPRQQGPPSFS